jgi:FKBP12-rapamycin complex-associated protein
MLIKRFFNSLLFFSPQAFVHDPLINWRLFNFNEVPQVSNYGNAHAHTVVSSEEAGANRELMQPQRGARERELLQVASSFHP